MCEPVDSIQLVVSQSQILHLRRPPEATQLVSHDGELGTVAQDLGVPAGNAVRVVSLDESIDVVLEPAADECSILPGAFGVRQTPPLAQVLCTPFLALPRSYSQWEIRQDFSGVASYALHTHACSPMTLSTWVNCSSSCSWSSSWQWTYSMSSGFAPCSHAKRSSSRRRKL